MDQIDIYCTANVLICEYCDRAVIYAAMRADEPLDAGDRDGQRVWMRVVEAINTLASADRGGLSLH